VVQVARLINNYQCEWKTTLEDPEKLKRFRQMINDDGDDPYVVTVEEREQPRPATAEEKLERIPVVSV
jgi:nitrite reductase (NADH) large subunit